VRVEVAGGGAVAAQPATQNNSDRDAVNFIVGLSYMFESGKPGLSSKRRVERKQRAVAAHGAARRVFNDAVPGRTP
jgi:hypothetical protein